MDTKLEHAVLGMNGDSPPAALEFVHCACMSQLCERMVRDAVLVHSSCAGMDELDSVGTTVYIHEYMAKEVASICRFQLSHIVGL